MSRRDEIRTCVACRYSRLECSPDCPLATYFPVAGNQDFQDVLRTYRPSHVKETLLRFKNKHDRDAAVKAIILKARHRRSARIQQYDADVQAQRRHVPDYVPGAGRQMVPGRRVFGLGQPTGSGQEIETRSGPEVNTEFGSGSCRTGREVGLSERTMADLYRSVFPIVESWIHQCEPIRDATGLGQEMEAQSRPGSRNEEVTTGWTPKDGDMSWIEDTIKYFFDGEE